MVVDLGTQEPNEVRRSLRVPDEDDGSAVVVVGQVVLPTREQALIRDLVRGGVVAQSLAERRTGPLAVGGGPHRAHARESRGLRHGRPLDGRRDRRPRVRGGRGGCDRGVDVEAIERSLGRRRGGNHRLRSVGADRVGSFRIQAGVVRQPRPAEPRHPRRARGRPWPLRSRWLTACHDHSAGQQPFRPPPTGVQPRGDSPSGGRSTPMLLLPWQKRARVRGESQ